MPAPTHVCEVVRTRALDGRELGLTFYGLGRRIRYGTTRDAPSFAGDVAWFEVSSKPKTRLGVVFLRQVEKPDRKIHWSR